MPYLCEILIVRVLIGITIDLFGFRFVSNWRTNETLLALEIVEVNFAMHLEKLQEPSQISLSVFLFSYPFS